MGLMPCWSRIVAHVYRRSWKRVPSGRLARFSAALNARVRLPSESSVPHAGAWDRGGVDFFVAADFIGMLEEAPA